MKGDLNRFLFMAGLAGSFLSPWFITLAVVAFL